MQVSSKQALLASLVSLCFLLRGASAQYQLADTYAGTSFFTGFDFFTAADPTNGAVTYVSGQIASNTGLAGYIDNQQGVFLGVDSTTQTANRPSVRVSSQKTYDTGLFLADISHMPSSTCGVWPAFWMVGTAQNWPLAGEIDIIEGVNEQAGNQVTLHTGPGCTASNTSGTASGKRATSATSMTGSLLSDQCNVYQTNSNSGCGVKSSAANTYGTGFNAGGGGVYATLVDPTDGIKIWFFARGDPTLASLSGSSVDVSSWPTPQAAFPAASCDTASHFQKMQIVFDTTFCGDWAGDVWTSDPVCSKLAPTCAQYVQQNPQAFTDAWWGVNSVKVYQGGSAASASASTVKARLRRAGEMLLGLWS